jgi:hypothetical protein
LASPADNKTLAISNWSTGTKILVGIILAVFVVFFFAVLTLTIAVMETDAASEFPYSTTYHVTLPDGEPVTIGNSRIVVMTYENEMVTDVDGTKEKLVVGQERIINPRHARITSLGIPVIDTDFQIALRYLGSTGNTAAFDITIRSSKQVPEILIRRLIPANMNAQPA